MILDKYSMSNNVEKWWETFFDDPCDNICENLHIWIKLINLNGEI